MKLLFDTNIILDVFLKRAPFFTDSQLMMSKVEEGLYKGYICGVSITTIDYLISKAISRLESRKIIKQLLKIFDVSTVDASVIKNALESKMDDFEDAVIAESAHDLDYIITRNIKDFKYSSTKAITPKEFLALKL